MIHLENLIHFMDMKQAFVLKKAWKDPVYIGIVLTLFIAVVGFSLFNAKNRELKKLTETETSTRTALVQKEKNVFLLREEVKKIDARMKKKSLTGDNLSANERKMSQVLEKMALSAAGQRVEVISFRPDSLSEEEKDVLLTAKVRVKTHFQELKEYLERLGHFPQPIRIDQLKIETPEKEPSYIYADLVFVTRISKEKHEI